jgi:hypothetical protein
MMIKFLQYFELIRDGGSLSFSFIGKDNCDYSLFFPIDKHHRVGNKTPVLINNTTKIEIDYSWEAVRCLVSEIERNHEVNDLFQLEIFKQIKTVVDSTINNNL